MKVYLTIPGGEMPVPGVYKKEKLHHETFFKFLRDNKDNLVSKLIHVSVAANISRGVGFQVGVDDKEESAHPVVLEKGDIMCVYGASDFKGISTGRGVNCSKVEYLGEA